MEDLVVRNYLSIIDRLDIDSKLSLLLALTENIQESIKKPKSDKTELLYQLYGCWDDVGDDLIEDIYSNRSISDREITFD